MLPHTTILGQAQRAGFTSALLSVNSRLYPPWFGDTLFLTSAKSQSLFHLVFPFLQGRKRGASAGHLSQHEDMSKRTIMAALLQVTGPIAIFPVVRQSWSFLRMLTVKQFQMAAAELQKLNLGQSLTVPGYRGAVFLKHSPEVAHHILLINPDLCEINYYATRYHQKKSSSIPGHLWSKLVSMGYVTDVEQKPSMDLPWLQG